ncbi:hypothetical protein BaRGS_00016245, partial [Batillaria attramentaria]
SNTLDVDPTEPPQNPNRISREFVIPRGFQNGDKRSLSLLDNVYAKRLRFQRFCGLELMHRALWSAVYEGLQSSDFFLTLEEEVYHGQRTSPIHGKQRDKPRHVGPRFWS